MTINDQQLQQKIEKLPQEYQPERELWGGIERAINQPSLTQEQENKTQFNGLSKRVNTPVAWAASIVVAVLVTWLSFSPSVTQGPQIADNSQSMPQSVLDLMTNNFTEQKQLMLASFGSPDIGQLPPEMLLQVKQLEQARKTIEKALADDENNVDLINLLGWTQQQELELLKKLYSPQWQTI